MLENKSLAVFQVDSFTGSPFKGNPAGVCVLEEPLPDDLMRNIAAEMNLSETAFAVKVTAGALIDAVKFNLRWFTPKCEVDLCGHATLAAAKVLHEIYQLKADTMTFTSRSGDLTAKRFKHLHVLDFPAGDIEPVELPDYMINALALPEFELDDKIHEAVICKRSKKLLIRFTDTDAVKQVNPNFNDLLQAEAAMGSRGIIVTAAGDRPYDFTSRFFAPTVGISEDPVTGSAHTVLGVYWAKMLNKKRLNAYQASKRGGELIVEFKENPKGHYHRVLISGQAVIVMEAVLKY